MTLIWLIVVAVAFVSGAQEKETKPKAEKPKFTQEELEARFKATFTKATMSGRWCSIDEGRLGPERKDQYVINSVAKIGVDLWLMNARLQYGEKEIVAPVPVKVKWADDAAVIIVDDYATPGGNNTYSARVMIHGNTYAGTWKGGDRGGLMSGVITQAKE